MDKQVKFSEQPTRVKIIYAAVLAVLCITAVVIGGASLAGGEGSLTGLTLADGAALNVNAPGAYSVTDSLEFAVCAILAIIVCHDAMGVRLETGKQAEVLNDLIEIIDMLTTEKLPEVKLKEFVGHTPFQVAAGVIVGMLNAFLWYHIWY